MRRRGKLIPRGGGGNQNVASVFVSKKWDIYPGGLVSGDERIWKRDFMVYVSW